MRSVLCALLLSLFGASWAAATTVTYRASGTVSSVEVTVRPEFGGSRANGDAILSAVTSLGVVVDAPFIVELDAVDPDLQPGDPNIGAYAVQRLQLTVGDYAIECCRSGADFKFGVFPTDFYTGTSALNASGGVWDTLGEVSTLFLNAGYDEILFATDALPTILPDASHITSATIDGASNKPPEELTVSFAIEEFSVVSVVPEAGSGSLVGLAFAAVAAALRRSR